MTEQLYTVPSTNLGMKFFQELSSVYSSNIGQVGPRDNDSKQSIPNFHCQQDQLLPMSHQVYKYDRVHFHSNDHTSRRLSLASADQQTKAHADTYNYRRKQSVAHKTGRQF
ncbi:Bgt-20133 [Blumeria graminis f. sp. tritici]|uniref:Bgt-20133 n=2 Tax=Blumeria graminis f. sp. tritici TaxID=62690 RepID=A0A9X9QG08_BLUGR|nr:Bgt-20133 [Blumeria graminis f. sp. tritici]